MEKKGVEIDTDNEMDDGIDDETAEQVKLIDNVAPNSPNNRAKFSCSKYKTLFLHAFSRLAPLLLLAFLYVFLLAGQSTMYFPFLRTLVHCKSRHFILQDAAEDPILLGAPQRKLLSKTEPEKDSYISIVNKYKDTSSAHLVSPPHVSQDVKDKKLLKELHRYRSSKEWSGSQVCDDRIFVAHRAQFFKGVTDSVEHFMQCLCLPLLGALTDLWGRKTVLALGCLGVCFRYLMLFAASLCAQNPSSMAAGLSFVCILSGSIVQGCTGGFVGAAYAYTADLAEEDEAGKGNTVGKTNFLSILNTPKSQLLKGLRSTYFSTLQGVKVFATLVGAGCVTFFVLAKNLTDYSSVFLYFSCFSVGVFLLARYGSIRETIAQPLEDSKIGSPVYTDELQKKMNDENADKLTLTWRTSSPLSPLRLFLRDPYLGHFALVIFLVMFGGVSVVILQAFLIAEFSWTQTEATIIIMGFGLMSLFSLVASAPLITSAKIGAVRLLTVSTRVAGFGLLLLCFSSRGMINLFHHGSNLLSENSNDSRNSNFNAMENLRVSSFVVGLCCLSVSATASPAYFEILSSRVKKLEQGKLQAAIGAVALAAISIGTFLHSMLFGLLHPSLRFLPFLIASISMFTGSLFLTYSPKLQSTKENF